MPPKMTPGPVPEDASIREAVCVHTKKIFDSCRDKDCIDNLRLYPTAASQAVIASAVSVRPISAQLLYVSVDVEEVAFNRGLYSIDLRYFYKVTGDAFTLGSKPVQISGLCVFDKRVILFGSEGNAKIFTSSTVLDGSDVQLPRSSNLPRAVVEAVDPVLLSMKLSETSDCQTSCTYLEVPDAIQQVFGDHLAIDSGCRVVTVTLGQFTIVRLERDTQLMIPAYDYCMPEKDCSADGCCNDPCALFSRIHFPVDEFFPPDTITMPEDYRDACSNTVH